MNALAPNAVWAHENTANVKIKLIRGHTKAINSCQFMQEDSKIFTCSNDNTARLWDTNSGAELVKFTNLHDGNISNGRVSQENNKFITSSLDKTVKCWDLETGKQLWKNDHNSFITCCGFSTDNNSKYAVSVSDIDYAIKIWDTHNGALINEIRDLHKNTITSCKFLPKYDRIVTTSMDKTSKFYDLVSNKTTLSLGGHTNIISNCTFTSDERTFLTSSWDKTLLIWDIATGMYRKKGPTVLAKGHEGSISSCNLSADGSLCVSGGYDLRVVLWDMNHATSKLILRGHTDWITDVAITSDNKWVLTVSKDKEIRLWGVDNVDDIKVVAEQNRNLGLNKIVKCAHCFKNFSATKLEMSPLTAKLHSTNLCVFCRLQHEQSLKLQRSDTFATESSEKFSKDVEKGVLTKFDITDIKKPF